MSLFRRRIGPDSPLTSLPAPMDRVTSVFGPATVVKGRLSGSGGVRIEGSFEGDISLDGLLVIGENGKVTSDQITATIVVIAGAVKGSITAEKVEIRATGRVWGDITTSAFATQEGAFLRGQVRMEEQLELEFSDEAEEVVIQDSQVAEAKSVETPAGAGFVDHPENETEKSLEAIPESSADSGLEIEMGGANGEEAGAAKPVAAVPKRSGRARKKEPVED